jgi:sarcosine oxidase subunit gamma
MDLMRSPLAGRKAVIAASGAAGAVSLRELPVATQIDLRGDPSSEPLIAAVRDVTGIVLPTSPNTVATNADRAALWLSPDEWLVVQPFAERASAIARLQQALAGQHVSVTDVSANRTILELAGPKAREVLAKGCGLDLHPRRFGPGQCAQTVVARTQALIWQTDDTPCYRVLVRPSFAGYLTDFLVDAMKEYALSPIPG